MTSTLFRHRAEGRLPSLLATLTLTTAALIVLLLLFLVRESLLAWQQIGPLRFFTDTRWAPTVGQYDLKPMLMGSLLVTVGAILVAGPIGILAGLFCRFIAPPWAAVSFRRILELLASVPSVVYGFWGLLVLVPAIAAYQPPGANLASGIVIVALMILPTIALASDTSLGAVPVTYLQGAAALGFSYVGTAIRIALPAARAGILAGLVLAAGRAVGETIAVLMVSGNLVAMPSSLMDPVRVLTANIALEMAYAAELHRSVLFASGLVLLVSVLGLVVVGRLAGDRRI